MRTRLTFLVAITLIFALVATGCGAKTYSANLTAKDTAVEPAKIFVQPTIRLVSLNGEPVEALPVVGKANIGKAGGNYQRILRIAPGQHTIVAGLGPMDVSASYGTGGGVGAIGPVGGGASVGVKAGGVATTSFVYPGSVEDEAVRITVEAGHTYRLDYDETGEDPGWTLSLEQTKPRLKKGDRKDDRAPDLVESMGRRPNAHADAIPGEPYHWYFNRPRSAARMLEQQTQK